MCCMLHRRARTETAAVIYANSTAVHIILYYIACVCSFHYMLIAYIIQLLTAWLYPYV